MNCLKHVRPGNGFVPAFPLLLKREVNGKNEDKLYTWLKSLCPNPTTFICKLSTISYSPIRTTDITWNFEKFLIDHHGQPIKRYTPKFKPENLSADITELIEACVKERRESRDLEEDFTIY